MENTEQNQSPTIEDLLKSAQALKYIGDRMLQEQISGYEAPRHWEAVQFVQAMFKKVDADITSHPSYNTYLENMKKQEE